MLNHLYEKIKEAMLTIVPVIMIVLILSWTPLFDLTGIEYALFLISGVLIILGIALFSLGAEMAMEPMGEAIGSNMMKTNKVWIVLFICIILSTLLTLVEPDVSELFEFANPLFNLDEKIIFMITIGLSTGLFLAIGIYRLIKQGRYKTVLFFSYLIMFSMMCLVIFNDKYHLLPLAFDSGGVTTGAISTPFIMAIGVGAAMTISGKKAKNDSFGFVALCSVGPIIGALVFILINDNLNIINVSSLESEFGETIEEIMHHTISALGRISLEVFIGLGLVFLAFIVINNIFLKLPKQRLIQIFIGIIYAFIGSVLFLTAASIGFHSVGYIIGKQLANYNSVWLSIIVFIIGLFVVLAEPAVHILADQVEIVTTGGVSKKSILIALSIGSGAAVLLSIIRIIFDFSIIYYLVPGFMVSFTLSLFVPRIYTAIAFDSGGVASGPITLSFILPMAMGACAILQPNNVAEAAFGIVAMIALTPLIAIQLLGFRDIIRKKQLAKHRLKNIMSSDDEIIIEFKR